MADFNETWPSCAFCKCGPHGPQYRGEAGPAYQNGTYYLFKYSLRRYAHAPCLAIKRGILDARAGIHEHERPHFDRRIAEALLLGRDALFDHAKKGSP